VPTFCRHNRFIERCPICSKTLPGHASSGRSKSTGAPTRARSAGASAKNASSARRRGSRGESLRVHREQRAEEDGYSSELVPGLRASADAERLAAEIAFSSGRLHMLGSEPPGLYGEARALAPEDLRQATWLAFLIAYLCPLEGPEPFAGIRLALRPQLGVPEDLADIPLGPRTSHDRARGPETLHAYRNWLAQGGAQAFAGDPSWSSQRRFERLFERLALPGLTRAARYDLLVTLGALGLYELVADSLHLSGARGQASNDPATVAAKRVFAIGDPIYLDRRAAALAEAVSVPVETLDLALANWGAAERATLGCPPDASDDGALGRARDALGL
jgi:hypothetical protein